LPKPKAAAAGHVARAQEMGVRSTISCFVSSDES